MAGRGARPDFLCCSYTGPTLPSPPALPAPPVLPLPWLGRRLQRRKPGALGAFLGKEGSAQLTGKQPVRPGLTGNVCGPGARTFGAGSVCWEHSPVGLGWRLAGRRGAWGLGVWVGLRERGQDEVAIQVGV